MNGDWQFRTTHALAKVYPDGVLGGDGESPAMSVFLGETASFQVAFRPPQRAAFRDSAPLRVDVDPAARPYVTLHSVDLVPCDLAAFAEHDDGYDRDGPGLYPDLLRPLVDGSISPILGSWRGLWVDFRVDDPALAGRHDIVVSVTDSRAALLYRRRMSVVVYAQALPRLPIAHTHWFHCDGLAEFYGCDVFSEQHWAVIDAFLGSAARMQVNTVLTPVWTPPLDTEVGGRRRRTQLLDITHADGRYAVDFTLLDRWLQLCRRHGMDRLEIAHLFTQWGALATPSIYVTRDGESVEAFGWHVSATDPSYRDFLEQVIPALKTHLDTVWGLDRVLFHISDEPSGAEHLASYARAKAVVADLLEPCTVIDALSDIEFYDSGTVEHAVVATDAIAPFLARGIRPLWAYYCVAQDRDVSNRFFAMPSSRNRVLGHQLFAHGCAGFLHWGFNFYNSELSRRPIDPFRDTTASGALLGGDAFMVYPGIGGQPWDSIRSKVFTQAMFDMRAFDRLAELAGRAAVLQQIDTDGRGGRLSFDRYSADPLHYLGVRENVNRQITALDP
ncbi:hypothetical protein ABIB25_001121 [Nakamurella sp. UYEF19]|uniref:DUF4091 domain-containing protein n=1 Tax=Nakamurella sp. UYEF19 TaxID=1756392 RepID=UPI0033958E69